MSNFTIDFFEFCFLVEACIPPRPIARAMFWNDVIEKHYHIMTPNERKKLFDWIQLNPSFNLEEEDCLWFYNRFNPNNQFLVTTLYNGETNSVETFKVGDRYYINKTTDIVQDYIIKVEPIIYVEDK